MEAMTVENQDRMTLRDLYARFEDAINLAASTEKAWARRARPASKKCIEVLFQFLDGEVTTDEVKAQFRIMTKLGDEVELNDAATYAILCLAETAHAAAHLGHLATSIGKRGDANREYDSLQKGYVMLGLAGVRRFADKAMRSHKC